MLFSTAGSMSMAIEVALGCSVLIVAFVSTFFLTRALLPIHRGYHVGQQIAVAIGFTTVSLGFIGLGLSYTPWKISFWSLATALTMFSIASLVIADYLQRHSKGYTRFREGLKALWEGMALSWHMLSLRDKLSWLFLCFAALFSLWLGPILASNQQETFSEFFIAPTKFPEEFPWRGTLASGDTTSIPVTVVSHETQAEDFHLQVLVNDQQYLFVELGILEPGQETMSMIPLSIGREGLHQVQLNLYKGDLSSPYRSLKIGLQVRSK